MDMFWGGGGGGGFVQQLVGLEVLREFLCHI